MNRAIACGTSFYAAMALVQVAVLASIAYLAVPHSPAFGSGELYQVGRQASLAPGAHGPLLRPVGGRLERAPGGASVLVHSQARACGRASVRFLVLVVGVSLGSDFFGIVIGQTIVQIGLTLCPALWVMVRELGYTLHFTGARRADYLDLMHFSVYVFLIQLSVVLADKIDTTILGFALSEKAAEDGVQCVPGHQQTIHADSPDGLDALVHGHARGGKPGRRARPPRPRPAQVRRSQASYRRTLTRCAPGVRLCGPVPVALLFGGRLPGGAGTYAWLMQLFLVAALPLLISVHVQMAIGMGKIRLIAFSALAGSLVNLPISCALTLRFGDVSGVIWGTVVTTLFSNLLVPAIYVFRVLEIRPATYLARTLGAPAAGALALLSVSWIVRLLTPFRFPGPRQSRAAGSCLQFT